MKYIFLILIFFSASALSTDRVDEDCGEKTFHEGKVFSLDIQTSFNGRALFKLCKSKSQNYLSVLTTQRAHKDNVNEMIETTTRRHIDISSEEYEKIFKLHEIALQYNTLDSLFGLDGSSWCIESQRGYTYTKACFWTPSNDPKQRGLKGLYDLGSFLWELTGLRKNKKMSLS